MRVQFFDRQDTTNPFNRTIIQNISRLRSVLQRARGRSPHFVELISDNGSQLLLGLGGHEGCVQFSISGEPPYLMAVSDQPDSEGELEFLIDDTPSPVPRRYCLPYEAVREIAEAFVQTGQRKADAIWEAL